MSNRNPHSFFKILIGGFVTLILFQLTVIGCIIAEDHWLGPVQDFWGSIPFIEKTLANGHWFNADLWIAQNNHRLVLPRLAFLIDYRYFSGSNHFLTTLGLGMLALEAMLLWILLKPFKNHAEQWLLLLAGLAVLTLPLVVYNLLHTFNTQWLQCAALAFLACTLFGTGLENNNRLLLIGGITAAMACNFTTFTLTSIWPALFLLLWLYRSKISHWLMIALIALSFSFTFVFLLPGEDIPGGHYELGTLTAMATHTALWPAILGLLQYLLAYLSLPDFPLGDMASSALTLASLLWLLFCVIRTSRFSHTTRANTNPARIFLALMFFCLCLAITTAIGRAYMGSIGVGPRFGPVVLLYWSALVIHVLLCIPDKTEKHLFNGAAAFILCCLVFFSVGNALNMSKRLSEDYNRFVIPQMAQLTGNLDKNAVYENLVPEWRDTSYPGIVAATPYLESTQRGIFALPLAQFIKNSEKIAWDKLSICGYATVTQKSRNQDLLIRNLVIDVNFESGDADFQHLVIYDPDTIEGIAFRKRPSIFQSFLKSKKTWIGISHKPINPLTAHILVFSSLKAMCQLEVRAN